MSYEEARARYDRDLFRPTVPQPSLEILLQHALMDDENDTTDGCSVPECDGTCPHGYPTWVRYLGLS